MSNQTPYYVAFSHMLGIGPVTFTSLLNHFDSVKNAYKAPTEALEPLLGNTLLAKFDRFRTTFDLEKKLSEIAKKNIHIVTQESPDYPQSLLAISDPPICLYLKGNKTLFDHAKKLFFAVVGTRRPTEYGRQTANKLSGELAQNGFTIVSGMAIGIDAIAHWATLKSGGTTIAVLGCGVDIVYPRENANLYSAIIEKGGAILSEFPPGMTVLPGLFVARNRIISGLSRGVLVIEGTEKSGTLITARYAAEQGRDVFATPAPITSLLSQAPNILLKQGAKLVTSTLDILQEYNREVTEDNFQKVLQSLDNNTRLVAEPLLLEPQTADEIAKATRVDIATILNQLTILEIRGIVAKNSDGDYYLK